MFRRAILAIVTLFTFATPIAISATPASAHYGYHSANCAWGGYTATGSSSTSSNGARNNCLYNLGQRIFGSCYSYIGGMISFYNSPSTYWFTGRIYSQAGNYYCGQQQILQASGYVTI